MEKCIASNESAPQEKVRKRYTYRDNSLPDRPVVFETFAEGILQADGKYAKEKGINPIDQSYIGCTIEDLQEIEKKEFEKFLKEHIEKTGTTLKEYGESAEENTYLGYMEELGLTPNELLNKKILDIGSAKSYFASYCLKHGISDSVYSVDAGEDSYTDKEVKKIIWPESLKTEIERKSKKALMQNLPYDEGSFDLVIAVAALPGRYREYHGELTMEQDVEQSYDEIVRMLAPGGEARIAPLYNDENNEYFGEWFKVTKKKLEKLSRIEGIIVDFEEIPEQESQRIIIRKALNRQQI